MNILVILRVLGGAALVGVVLLMIAAAVTVGLVGGAVGRFWICAVT